MKPDKPRHVGRACVNCNRHAGTCERYSLRPLDGSATRVVALCRGCLPNRNAAVWIRFERPACFTFVDSLEQAPDPRALDDLSLEATVTRQNHRIAELQSRVAELEATE